jgi:hypothetical protein
MLLANTEKPTTAEQGEAPKIKAFGLIKKIENSGYPIYTVTVDFPEKKTSA